MRRRCRPRHRRYNLDRTIRTLSEGQRRMPDHRSVSGYRTEKDSMGEMQVPASALYGATTARAVENFPISGITFSRPFLRAIGLIKLAAARANQDLGLLATDR